MKLLTAIFVSIAMIAPAIAVERSSVVDGVSCLKADGDWLDGVTKKECKSIGGQWKMVSCF